MRRFGGNHVGGGIEAEQPCQFGAGDQPVFPGLDGHFFQVCQQGAGAVGLDGGGKAGAQTLDTTDQFASLEHRVHSPRHATPGLLDIEVGDGDLHEGIVLRGLHLEAFGPQHLLGGQWGVDGVGGGEDGLNAGTQCYGLTAVVVREAT